MCSCETLYDRYYAVVTQAIPDEVNVLEDRSSVPFILLLIVLPLLLMGCLVPCVLVQMDHKDFVDLHDQVHQVDSQIINKFEQARGKASKHEIFFNEKEIKQYLQYSDLGCCTAFRTFNRTLHPLISLFTNYDFRLSRLARFTLVLGQVSLITILIWVCFSKNGDDVFGNKFEERIIFVSLPLSLITLPLPRRFVKCIER